MPGEWKILIWWLLFGGTHLLGSLRPVRAFLIGRLGLPPFKGLYSLVAFATFIPLCLVFARNRHAGAVLFDPPPLFLIAAQVLMLAALTVLLQGLLTPGPMTTLAEMTGGVELQPRGIHRITRHPQNTAFALFGIAHMIANPFAGDWVFFGGFVLFGLVGSLHQDSRTAASHAEAGRKFIAATSLLPFVTLIRRKGPLPVREFNFPGLGAAVALWAVLRYFHPVLFGGFGG